MAGSSLTCGSSTDCGKELDDFSSDCQWGRYNAHFLEPDGERTGQSSSSSDKRPLRPKVSIGGESGAPRIKRHVSDAAARRGGKRGGRVGRRQSEGPNGAAAVARTRMHAGSTGQLNEAVGGGSGSSVGGSRFGVSGGSCLEPCLRLSIIRHESDLRKKRVAFSDAPAVVWNDPPVVLFTPSAYSAPATHHHQHSAGSSAPSRRHSYPSNSLASADGSDSGSKEGAEEGGDEVLTPKERRRRKVVMAVVCTTFILLTASALFVLITLFNASAIDEAVRKEHEQTFTSVSSNGDIHNGTTTVLSPIGDHRDFGLNLTTATPIANLSGSSTMMNPAQ